MTVATHPVTPEEIMALLDSELSVDRAQDVSAHVKGCPECQGVKESIWATSQKLAGWKVAAPRRLHERTFLSNAERTASKEKLRGGLSWVHDILARKWIWAPALSLVVALFAFVVLLPNLFVAHKVVAPRNAVMLQRVDPTDMKGYSVDHATVAGGGGGAGDLVEEGKLKTPPPQPPRGSHGGEDGSVPMIARTISLAIVVKDFDAGRASLDAILARHNGYAAGLNVVTPQGAARTLQASLRIPAAQLAAALTELKALGRLEAETQNGEEVTQQHADLVARLKNSRETEQRLQDVLRTRTGKVKDVLEVEQEIARVRGEIEQMEAEQKTLEHRVDFSTIDLKFAEEYQAQLSSPAPSIGMQLRNATINGFRSASESVLGIVLFFAESGPTFLLWLVILFVPARLLWRRYQRAHALGSLGA